MGFQRLEHPDDLEKVRDSFHKALAGQPVSNHEYRIITKSGETRWICHSCSPVLMDGKVQVIVSIIKDITASKLVEQTLREAYDDMEKAYQLGRSLE